MKQKQKIFFIYPPYSLISGEQCVQKLQIGSFMPYHLPPYDMMLLSSVAKKRGYETFFKDYGLENETVHDFLRDLRKYKPDFLVVNVSSPDFKRELCVLHAAKEFLDDTVVIAKGDVFNFNSYSVMQSFPEIDIVLRADNEDAFDEIIQYKSLNDVKGITYRINNKITATVDRDARYDLNHLPFFDRDLTDNLRYRRPDTKRPITCIRVSKGCLKECFSCIKSSANTNQVCQRLPKLIVAEIKECIFKYNIKDFVFLSDAINCDNDWLQNLCGLILEEGLDINFCCNLRIDNIDIDTLKIMKKAGCYMISIGFESAFDNTSENPEKSFSFEQVKSAVKTIENAGIMVHASYVVGLPWETRKTIKETFKSAKRLNTHFASFYTAVPFLGTKFFDFIKKNRLGKINYKKPFLYPCVNSCALTTDEIYEYFKAFNRNYCLRARYILKIAKQINSTAKLKIFYKAFVDLLENKSDVFQKNESACHNQESENYSAY